MLQRVLDELPDDTNDHEQIPTLCLSPITTAEDDDRDLQERFDNNPSGSLQPVS